MDEYKLSEYILESINGSISHERLKEMNDLIVNTPNGVTTYIELIKINSSLNQLGAGSPNISLSNQNDKELSTEQLLREAIIYQEKIEANQLEQTIQKRKRKIAAAAQSQLDDYLKTQYLAETEAKRIFEKNSKPKSRLYKMMSKVFAACLVMSAFIWILQSSITHSKVATLLTSHAAQWSNGDIPIKTDLLTGNYNLIQGLAEIEFSSGATILLQGPAIINLESTNGAYLKQGKLLANIPARAHGFTINTSSSTFVDFGTQFGLHINQDGSSECHVFQGQVGIQTIASQPTAYNYIETGQAKKVSSDGTTITDIQLTTSYLSQEIPHYFKFNKLMTSHTATNCTNPLLNIHFDNKNSLQANSKISLVGDFQFIPGPPGPFDSNNHAILFEDNNNYLRLKYKDEFEWREGFSWTLRFNLKDLTNQCIFKSFNKNEFNEEGDFTSTLYIEKRHSQHTLNYLFILEDEDDIEKNDFTHNFTSKLNDSNQWHLAVFTINNDNARFYLDGRLISIFNFTEKHKRADSSSNNFIFGLPMQLAHKPKISSNPSSIFPGLKGAIDEFAIYPCELTKNEISHLHSQFVTQE